MRSTPPRRTLLIEVQVANPGGALMPGMYAQVDLAVPRKDPPLLIPGDTLVVRSDGPQVAVVGPTARSISHCIQLGRDFGDHIEVLSASRRPAGGRESGRRGARRRQSEARVAPKKQQENVRYMTTMTHYRPVQASQPCACRSRSAGAAHAPRHALAQPTCDFREFAARPRLDPRRQSVPLAAGRAGPGHREQSRYRTAALQLPMADTELLRAKGGGTDCAA